jgi:hypothetical protein
MKKYAILLAALCCGVFGHEASASTANLITNGDFSAGTFDGWTQGGSTGAEHIADQSALLGPFGTGRGSLSQTVATTIGQSYTFSFDLATGSNFKNNSFAAEFNLQDSPVSLLSLTNTGKFDFTNYVLTFIATAAKTTLGFDFANNLGNWQLDNVMLTADNVATTPLPASSALFCPALA